MDDVRAQAAQWCDQARQSCDEPGSSDLENLTHWLNAIDEGLRLRRQLDGPASEPMIESTRGDIVRRLTELQLLADRAMATLKPGSPAHQLVAARAKEGLADARAAVRGVATGLRLGLLHQALALEGLRADLEWLSTLVARLDGETTPQMAAWLDVELQRLRGWLAAPSNREADPRDAVVRTGCERLQAVLLNRRIDRELGEPSVGWTADGLWTERFHLSRLQAQAEALHADASAPPAGAGPADWVDVLKRRREELACEAFDRLGALERVSRAQPCERIVRTAIDEVGEMIAFLEDMPLYRAVTRLELMQDDLEELAKSCRRWSREPGGGSARPADPCRARPSRGNR